MEFEPLPCGEPLPSQTARRHAVYAVAGDGGRIFGDGARVVINPDQTGATGTTGTAGAPLVPASAGGDPFGLDWGLSEMGKTVVAT